MSAFIEQKIMECEQRLDELASERRQIEKLLKALKAKGAAS